MTDAKQAVHRFAGYEYRRVDGHGYYKFKCVCGWSYESASKAMAEDKIEFHLGRYT